MYLTASSVLQLMWQLQLIVSYPTHVYHIYLHSYIITYGTDYGCVYLYVLPLHRHLYISRARYEIWMDIFICHIVNPCHVYLNRFELWSCVMITMLRLSEWLWLCYDYPCDYEYVTIFGVIMNMLRLFLWLWLCYDYRCEYEYVTIIGVIMTMLRLSVWLWIDVTIIGVIMTMLRLSV